MELETIEQIAEKYHTPFGVRECREIHISKNTATKQGILKVFRVGEIRMEIKRINGHIYKYGLRQVGKYRENKLLEQSDNPNHLLHKMYNKYVIKW